MQLKFALLPVARSSAVQITLSFIWALDYGTKIKFKLFAER